MEIRRFLRSVYVGPLPPKEKYGEIVAAGKQTTTVGRSAFITAQSFASYPVAVAVISTAWGLCKRLDDRLSTSWTALVFAALVGLVIFLINVDDERSKPKSVRGWLIAIIIACFNSLTLAAAVLGVSTVAAPSK